MGRCAVPRRLLLRGCLAAPAALRSHALRADDEQDPNRLKLPQPGDRLVEVGSDPGASSLKLSDIGLQTLVLAWAFDPIRKIARDASRLNMVILMRFDPTTLGAVESRIAPAGIVGYSAICTHQQCWATDWLKTAQLLQCPCHQSRFDLREGAKVVGGPAPRPLPALPLSVDDTGLSVAGPFTARVGGEPPQGT
jgi:rieske iron-sulfur protein